MNTLTETQVRLFASSKSWIEGEAVRQLYATARLDGVRQAMGFLDLHPGKGSPVGAAFVTEGKIYPHIIGGDIGCGMALFKTDLVRRDAKLDRWAEKYFHLEHPWDEEVGEFLAEHDLESTEFDSSLGIPVALTDTLLQVFGVAGILASIALLITNHQVLTTLGRIVSRLDNIAQGELTDVIPLSREDELGKLNNALITMQTHLKAMMAEIAESADLMGDSAQVLSGEMETTRCVTQAQSDAVSGIAVS